MEQMNRVELRGVVGDINVHDCDDAKMARIALATNYAFKDRSSRSVIDTSWHNVIACEGRGIHDLNKIKKGTRLHVIGRIRYQTYRGEDGEDHIGTDIIASRVKIVDDPNPLSYEKG